MTRPDPCPQPLCILDIPEPSACDDCPNVPTPKNPAWGGRRTNTGAPRGNLNALKHGHRSRQLDQALERLASDPELAPLLLFFTRFAARQHGIKI